MNPIHKKSNSLFRKFVACIVLCSFMGSTVLPANAQGVPGLPAPGVMLAASEAFHPPIMRGLKINPNNPLQFDFYIDTGDDNLQGKVFEDEATKLIKYFLASITVPENEIWVNLSPYEQVRIIPDGLGATELGRDMLKQDYLLKQITASLIYPEERLGSEFWKKVYARAQEEYGTTDIPVDTFNKVWIVPDKAVVYEKNGSAFVGERHLKVMLEEDYLALAQGTPVHQDTRIPVSGNPLVSQSSDHPQGVPVSQSATSMQGVPGTHDVNALGSQIIREIILPALEREVNEGKNFANLRQIYNSMILATWYKQTLKESLLGQVYMNKNKVKGVDVEDKAVKQKIYDQYLEAFKKGVYNYIKEDIDPASQEIIPRKYFSGGLVVPANVESRGLGQEPPNAAVRIVRSESGDLRVVVTTLLENAVQKQVAEAQQRQRMKQLIVNDKVVDFGRGYTRVLALFFDDPDVQQEAYEVSEEDEYQSLNPIVQEIYRAIEGLQEQLQFGKVAGYLGGFLTEEYLVQNNLNGPNLNKLLTKVLEARLRLVKGEYYVDGMGDVKVLAHAGRNTQGMYAKQAIWMGEMALRSLSDNEVIMLMIEEGLHLLKPDGVDDKDIFHNKAFLEAVGRKLETAKMQEDPGKQSPDVEVDQTSADVSAINGSGMVLTLTEMTEFMNQLVSKGLLRFHLYQAVDYGEIDVFYKGKQTSFFNITSMMFFNGILYIARFEDSDMGRQYLLTSIKSNGAVSPVIREDALPDEVMAEFGIEPAEQRAPTLAAMKLKPVMSAEDIAKKIEAIKDIAGSSYEFLFGKKDGFVEINSQGAVWGTGPIRNLRGITVYNGEIYIAFRKGEVFFEKINKRFVANHTRLTWEQLPEIVKQDFVSGSLNRLRDAKLFTQRRGRTGSELMSILAAGLTATVLSVGNLPDQVSAAPVVMHPSVAASAGGAETMDYQSEDYKKRVEQALVDRLKGLFKITANQGQFFQELYFLSGKVEYSIAPEFIKFVRKTFGYDGVEKALQEQIIKDKGALAAMPENPATVDQMVSKAKILVSLEQNMRLRQKLRIADMEKENYFQAADQLMRAAFNQLESKIADETLKDMILFFIWHPDSEFSRVEELYKKSPAAQSVQLAKVIGAQYYRVYLMKRDSGAGGMREYSAAEKFFKIIQKVDKDSWGKTVDGFFGEMWRSGKVSAVSDAVNARPALAGLEGSLGLILLSTIRFRRWHQSKEGLTPAEREMIQKEVNSFLKGLVNFEYTLDSQLQGEVLITNITQTNRSMPPVVAIQIEQGLDNLRAKLSKGLAVELIASEDRYSVSLKFSEPLLESQQVNDVGGIDFNSELLDLQIKRDTNGVPLPVSQQPILNMNIEGFIPVIINVTPVNPSLLLSELSDSPQPEMQLSQI